MSKRLKEMKQFEEMMAPNFKLLPLHVGRMIDQFVYSKETKEIKTLMNKLESAGLGLGAEEPYNIYARLLSDMVSIGETGFTRQELSVFQWYGSGLAEG